MRLFTTLVAAALIGVAGASAAFAQEAGSVGATTGPSGSTLVSRGGTSYSIKEGDALSAGDKVYTRSDATVTISFNGCSQTLQSGQTVTLNAQFCTGTPLQLASTEVIDGITIGAGAGGTIGATPILLGALAAGGLATGLSGGSSSP